MTPRPPVRPGRIARRVVLLTIALLAVLAAPAGADAPKPTDYRSRVRSVEPPSPHVTVAVVGGDGFLSVTADRGHEVVVQGYQGEPYLRIRRDGTVEENQQSPATYINRSRYGASQPGGLHPDGPPQWTQVASGGEYAWHDHRIHWMLPDPPASLKGGTGRVQEVGTDGVWKVPLTVDGRAVVVSGDLYLLPGVNPLPWLALALAVLAVTLVLGRRRMLTASVVASLVASILAVVAGYAEYQVAPPGSGFNPLILALPVAALVAATLAAIQRSDAIRVIATLAAVASLGGWLLLRYTVLLRRILPTDLSPGVARAAVAAVLGLTVAAAVLAVRSGALAPPPDDEDDAVAAADPPPTAPA